MQMAVLGAAFSWNRRSFRFLRDFASPLGTFSRLLKLGIERTHVANNSYSFTAPF